MCLSAGRHLAGVLEHVDARRPKGQPFGGSACRLVSTYTDVVNAIQALIGELATAERAAILGGTARRVYRLGPAS